MGTKDADCGKFNVPMLPGMVVVVIVVVVVDYSFIRGSTNPY
jgi:hypothetical protein